MEKSTCTLSDLFPLVHLSVFALLLLFRPGNVSATGSGSKEYNVSSDYYDQDLLKTSQDQSERAETSCDDANRSQVQIQPFSFLSRISLWKACSTIFLVLGLAALLFLVVLLCAIHFIRIE